MKVTGVHSVGTPIKHQTPGLVIFSFMSNALGLPLSRGAATVLVLDGKHGNGHGNVVRSAVVVLNHSEWAPTRVLGVVNARGACEAF